MLSCHPKSVGAARLLSARIYFLFPFNRSRLELDKFRYTGLAAAQQFRIVQFVPQDEESKQKFLDDARFEAHFHGFYRTSFAGTPWTFRMAGGADGLGGRNVLEVLDPEIPGITIAEVIDDLRTKLENLFSCYGSA